MDIVVDTLIVSGRMVRIMAINRIFQDTFSDDLVFDSLLFDGLTFGLVNDTFCKDIFDNGAFSRFTDPSSLISDVFINSDFTIILMVIVVENVLITRNFLDRDSIRVSLVSAPRTRLVKASVS